MVMKEMNMAKKAMKATSPDCMMHLDGAVKAMKKS
jgi:hypothetical protein